MDYRRLGRTGLRVSAIGIGGGGIGHVWGPTTDEECREVVRRAIDLGVNFFDVAPAYGDGKAERILGEAARERRGQCYFATKVWVTSTPGRETETLIRASVEASLNRLQTDYIDLLQLHFPVSALEDILGPGGYLQTFRRLQVEGTVRFIGFTGAGEVDALRRLVETGEFDTVQVSYNLLDEMRPIGSSLWAGTPSLRGSQLIEWAHAHDLGVIGIRPLAFGALTDQIDRPIDPLSDHRIYRDVERARGLRFLVGGEIQTLSQAALVFVLMNPKVSTVIPGVKSVAELEEAVACLGKGPLPAEALHRVESLLGEGDGKG